MARAYNKKSEYWEIRKSNASKNIVQSPIQTNSGLNINYEPAFLGEPIHQSEASRNGSASTNSTEGRFNTAPHLKNKIARYSNIYNGIMPFESSVEGYSMREAIKLCQLAYCNVQIFRNAIDIVSEFSNADIILEKGSKKSRRIIEAWFEKIKLWQLRDEYFREYYRSGNVFLYKILGKFDPKDFTQITKEYSDDVGIKNQIPIDYIMLNPYEVAANKSSSFKNGIFYKIGSEYDLERLQNPKTKHDEDVKKALPKDVKKQLEVGAWPGNGVRMQLQPENLVYSFYKKQSYEPLACPCFFPILDDINFKLELKKIDQTICRTIENVILLVTMGCAPDKNGAVYNYGNLSKVQELLRNESVGRVLVSDYTTKAEFVIPDLNKILGPEKYQIVNEDIKEGLQNILIGSEKFANTSIKASVFFERLKEGRRQFLNDVLQPEIEFVCKNLGLRDVPKARFEEISLKDEAEFNRVITRMMELGILPPEEAFKVIETGVYPSNEDLEAGQQKYLENRKKGWFNPLVGGVPSIKDPNQTDTQTPAQRPLPNKVSGRPPGAKTRASFSVKGLTSATKSITDLGVLIENLIKKKHKLKSLNQDQFSLVSEIICKIISSDSPEHWGAAAKEIIQDIKKIETKTVKPEVEEISKEFKVDTYSAAILYNSQLFDTV
jgi:hypothetical protein